MAVVAKHLIVDLSPESFGPQIFDSHTAKATAPQAELSSEAHEAHPSPARDLQVALESRLGGDGLWSRRRMLAVAIGFSAVFWASVVAAFVYVMAH